MPDGKLGRYQYLEDPNWVPEAYIIDYETHKRYYPKHGMDVIVELLNFQDNKITELKRDYGREGKINNTVVNLKRIIKE